jgi:starch phosphorylase
MGSVGAQDVVRRYKETHSTFDAFPDKVAFQLNDTHPTIAVPELMRVLMDENKLGWTKSWDITTKVCTLTAHRAASSPLEG